MEPEFQSMKKTTITFCLLFIGLFVFGQTDQTENSKSMETGWVDLSQSHAYFKPDYSYHFEDSCYRAVAEKVSRKDWEKAFEHRMEYNYYRDTNDFYRNALAKLSVFRTLNDEGKETFAIWQDFSLGNVGLDNVHADTIASGEA